MRVRLTELGAKFLHIHGEALQEKAVDCIICWHGKYVAVELKIGNNQATPHQANFLAGVRAAGGLGFVAWSVAGILEELNKHELG